MLSQEAALAELDERLDGLMEVVRLSYLIKREGGWGAVCEWGETLSLGLSSILGTRNVSLIAPQQAIMPDDEEHPDCSAVALMTGKSHHTNACKATLGRLFSASTGMRGRVSAMAAHPDCMFHRQVNSSGWAWRDCFSSGPLLARSTSAPMRPAQMWRRRSMRTRAS